MAKFIGSDLQSDNWGEDYLIKKLIVRPLGCMP